MGVTARVVLFTAHSRLFHRLFSVRKLFDAEQSNHAIVLRAKERLVLIGESGADHCILRLFQTLHEFPKGIGEFICQLIIGYDSESAAVRRTLPQESLDPFPASTHESKACCSVLLLSCLESRLQICFLNVVHETPPFKID